MYVCYWPETEVYSSIFTAAKLPLANGSKWDDLAIPHISASAPQADRLYVNSPARQKMKWQWQGNRRVYFELGFALNLCKISRKISFLNFPHHIS